MTGRRRLDAEGGAAALTAVLSVLLALSIALPAVLAVLDAVAAVERARTAADAAALAVLAGSPLAGGDGLPDRAAGDRVAAANGGRLTRLDRQDWPLAVGVVVAVEPAGRLARIAGPATAVATAALHPP